ncbi:hypothetical protein AMOR_05520 [Anaeromyxobacter oryzae]|uniref:Uncharacterized protein n=1 Tax=Anaeromyxobacter oryzae TaxID=2918170 RepID=A0ABM7WQ18_9BACT|nr:hypothetical protein AMOR_05520 [Anaeromyxobacter oryzae]
MDTVGVAVVGRNIDARTWHLPGWQEPLTLAADAGERAMRLAIASARVPQRIRMGASWLKDQAAKVAATPWAPRA